MASQKTVLVGGATGRLGVIVRGAELDQDALGPGLRALFAWLDRVGHNVDIAGLRAAYPDVRWHRFEGWVRMVSHHPDAQTEQLQRLGV